MTVLSITSPKNIVTFRITLPENVLSASTISMFKNGITIIDVFLSHSIRPAGLILCNYGSILMLFHAYIQRQFCGLTIVSKSCSHHLPYKCTSCLRLMRLNCLIQRNNAFISDGHHHSSHLHSQIKSTYTAQYTPALLTGSCDLHHMPPAHYTTAPPFLAPPSFWPHTLCSPDFWVKHTSSRLTIALKIADGGKQSTVINSTQIIVLYIFKN